jgi:hypothetical protein
VHGECHYANAMERPWKLGGPSSCVCLAGRSTWLRLHLFFCRQGAGHFGNLELPSDSAIQYGEMHAMKSPRTQVFQSGRQSWLGYSWKRTSPGFLDKKMRSPLPYTISRCRWCDRTILRFEPHEEPRISVNLVHISYGDFLLRDRIDTR